MSAPVRKRSFTVSAGSDRKLACSRCGAKLRAGERATVLRGPSTVLYRHAGRVCPGGATAAAIHVLQTQLRKELR